MSNTTITVERETLNNWQLITVRVGDDGVGATYAELNIYRTGRADEWRYIAQVACFSNLDDGSYSAFTGQGNGNSARTAATLAIRETVTKLFSLDTRGYRNYELADWAMQVSYLMSGTNSRF